MRANVAQEGVARSWRERGFSCGLWVDPPGQVWADYVHDVDALVMVVEGDGWMGMRVVCSWEIGSAVTLSETPPGAGYFERGTLLAFEPKRLLGYDHWSPLWRVPDIPENRAVVTLRVEPEGGGTRVHFSHELPVVEAIAEHSDSFVEGS